jgi:hypothetical protein
MWTYQGHGIIRKRRKIKILHYPNTSVIKNSKLKAKIDIRIKLKCKMLSVNLMIHETRR